LPAALAAHNQPIEAFLERLPGKLGRGQSWCRGEGLIAGGQAVNEQFYLADAAGRGGVGGNGHRP
jgi:hypothetical protein